MTDISIPRPSMRAGTKQRLKFLGAASLVLLFQVQGIVEFLGWPTLAYRTGVLFISMFIVALYWRTAVADRSTAILAGTLVALTASNLIGLAVSGASAKAVGLSMYRDAYFALTAAAFIQVGRRITERQFTIILLTMISVFVGVSLFKVATVGVEEKYWLGTLSMTAGQLGIIYPAMLAPVFLFIAPFQGIAVAFALGVSTVIHEKRAVIGLFPVLLFASVGLVLWRDKMLGAFTLKRSLAILGAALLAAIAVLALSFTSIPSLNPGQERGGGNIDLGYVFNYADEYLTRGYESELNNDVSKVDVDTGIQVGRAKVFTALIDWSAARPVGEQVFGAGPGTVDRSYLLGPDRSDIFYSVTGIRGPVTLFHELLVERGWFGVASLFVPLVGLLGWLAYGFVSLLMARSRPSFAHWVAGWAMLVTVMDLALYSTISYLIPAGMVIIGLSLGRMGTSK